jgi:arabinan endo-1,5-alpha-L-arabinosidase
MKLNFLRQAFLALIFSLGVVTTATPQESSKPSGQTAAKQANPQVEEWLDTFDGKALDLDKWELFSLSGGNGKVEVKNGQLRMRGQTEWRAGVRSKQTFTGDRFIVEGTVAKVEQALPDPSKDVLPIGNAILTILFDGSGRNRIEWILTSEGTFEAWSVVDGRGERLDNRKLGTKTKNPTLGIVRKGDDFFFMLNGQEGLHKTIKNLPRSFRIMLYGFSSSENDWDSVRVVTAKQSSSHAGAVGGRDAPAKTYLNPVFDTDFPDPTVIHASDGWYYAYATQTILNGKMVNIQVARSRDMTTWEHLGDALPIKPMWANQTQKFWAPHVSQAGETYYLYYSADANTLTGLCLAVATSKSARGPFADSGKPLKCGESFVNIDPMAFDDPVTGKHLLYWGSGFKPIKVQELAPDRTSFMPGSQPVDLISVIKDERPANYQRLVEGAWVTARDGYYYLFYSGDNCCGDKAHYAVMVARSKSATGPFETLAQATRKSNSAILERNERWIAPGHNSVIRDSNGQDWIFYHAIDSKNRLLKNDISGDRDVRRIMLMDRLVYRNGWPVIDKGSPSTTLQPAPNVR